MEENKKKNIVIIILILVILLLSGYIAYTMFNSKEEKSNDTTPSSLNNKEEKTDDNTSSNVLYFYGDTNGQFCDKAQHKYCNKILKTIKPNSENAYIVHIIDGGHSALYYDDGLKYIQTSNYSKTIEGISEKDINGIRFVDGGFIINSENEHYYYKYNQDKKLYSDSDYISAIQEYGEPSTQYIAIKKGDTYSVLDLDKDEIVLTRKNDGYGTELVFEHKGEFFITYESEEMYVSNIIIYTLKGKEVVKLNAGENYDFLDMQSNNVNGIRIYKENNIKGYDTNGKEINLDQYLQ